MDTLAYIHLHLVDENPVTLTERNWSQICKSIVFGVVPILAVNVVTAVTPAWASLSYGSTGTHVTALQETLKSLGYFPQDVRTTGYYGAITKQAVIKFQQASKLPTDGVVGPATATALESVKTQPIQPETQPVAVFMSSEILRVGTQGPEVRQVQLQLAALGYFRGKINGVFEGLTEEAVADFQAESSLEIDGVVGPNTRKALLARVEGI